MKKITKGTIMVVKKIDKCGYFYVNTLEEEWDQNVRIFENKSKPQIKKYHNWQSILKHIDLLDEHIELFHQAGYKNPKHYPTLTDYALEQENVVKGHFTSWREFYPDPDADRKQEPEIKIGSKVIVSGDLIPSKYKGKIGKITECKYNEKKGKLIYCGEYIIGSEVMKLKITREFITVIPKMNSNLMEVFQYAEEISLHHEHTKEILRRVKFSEEQIFEAFQRHSMKKSPNQDVLV